jgi:Prolipoprotein diacylglyceryltransferase
MVISRFLHVIDNIVVAKLHPELARAGSVIDYTQYPGQIIGGAGLTIWGAVLGAALGIWVYSKFSKIQFGYLADLIVPGLILAQLIGRIGCTINGCCYGTACSLPWSITYTHLDSLAPIGIAVHPTTVYEIIYLLIMFGIALWLKGRLRPDGSLFLVYLSLYSLWRLGIDFLREGTPFLLGLHQAQVIGIIVLAIAVPLLAHRIRWVKTELESKADEKDEDE